jgi:hypothetical protein
MKRNDLIKKLVDMQCLFIRHGGNHDWYQNPRTKMAQPIPRHNDINENLAKSILKKLRDNV